MTGRDRDFNVILDPFNLLPMLYLRAACGSYPKLSCVEVLPNKLFGGSHPITLGCLHHDATDVIDVKLISCSYLQFVFNMEGKTILL